MNREQLIGLYLSLFEKLYGQVPAGDLHSFSDEEIQQNVDELQQLYDRYMIDRQAERIAFGMVLGLCAVTAVLRLITELQV